MFQPIIPIGGLGGWRFLQDTYESQFKAFTQSTQLNRDTEYFRENIGKIETAEELVSDRRLLSVTLGAFGLSDDINSKFFIQKMLQEGSVAEDALANRFTDGRYLEMTEAFGFGPGEFLKVGEADFVEAIITRFETLEFEVAAGEQNEAMRFALYAEREMELLANEDISNDAKWFTLMGFKDRAKSEFGTDDLTIFSDPEVVQELITKYVVRDQIKDFNNSFSSNSIALTLLRGF